MEAPSLFKAAPGTTIVVAVGTDGMIFSEDSDLLAITSICLSAYLKDERSCETSETSDTNVAVSITY